MVGKDPLSMEHLIAKGHDLTMELEASAKSLHHIVQKVESGEGTFGKLLMDDKLYYDIEDLVAEIKRNPWKLLRRGKETDDRKKERR